MTALFIVSVGIIVYTYAVIPLLLAVFGSILRHPDAPPAIDLPTVTLIVSAYNEESVIREKITNCLAQDYPQDKLEIVIASESTDATNEIAGEFAARGVVLLAFTGRRGKSATLYRTLPSVKGEIVVFSDANAIYRPDAVRKLVRNFSDPGVGCVIGQLRYRDPSDSVGGQGESMYWSYEMWIRKHASNIEGIVPGVNGAIFAIRKELYRPIAEDRGDDFELCTRIVIDGYRAKFEPQAIAEEQASETTSQQFRRKVRLARWNIFSSIILFREAVGRLRWRVAFQLISHRLLRYFSSVWLATALLANIALSSRSDILMLLLWGQLVFYVLGMVGLIMEIIGCRAPKLCLAASYFLMVNLASGVAIFLSLSRGQATLWQKVR